MEILFYTILVIGVIAIFIAFFFIPIDNNPYNDNTPAYTYDGDQVIDNNDYGDSVKINANGDVINPSNGEDNTSNNDKL